MRAVLALPLLVLSLASAVPSVGAQPPTTTIVSDPAGDVRVQNWAGPDAGPVPAPALDHLDLVSLWMANETAVAIDIGVKLRRWTPLTPGTPVDRFFDIHFAIGFQNFSISMSGSCPSDQARVQSGRNFGYHPERPFACRPTTIDPAAATLVVHLSKADLMNHRYVPLQIGDKITNLHAIARGYYFAYDQVPDALPGPEHVSRVGPGAQAGDLFLSAEKPIRASNGEATSLLYRLTLENAGDSDRTVLIDVENPNPEWAIRAPQRVHVAAKSQRDLPVILSMNFSHEHGKTMVFHVHAKDATDPAHFSSTQLGVRWLDIPQPAGHHDRLWLHSRPNQANVYGSPVKLGDLGFMDAWMNTLETDPGPLVTDGEIPPNPSNVLYANSPGMWRVHLRPDLEIGIDPDSARGGSFEGKIRVTMPATRSSLNVTVAYCDMTRTLAGRLSPECDYGIQVDVLWGLLDLGAFAPNTVRAFTVPLTANASLEKIPYQPGGELAAFIRLNADTPQDFLYAEGPPDAMLVTKGSTFQLPLLEYHDPIDQDFEDVGSLRLEPLDEHMKSVNPGRTSVFRFDLTNRGIDSQRLRLLVEGVNSAWATIHGSTDLSLAPNEKRMVTMRVVAPDDAQPGERAELFFVAENVDDPTIVALARVRAEVVDGVEISDEATILDAPDQRGTPAVGLLPIVVALAALVGLRRRRVR